MTKKIDFVKEIKLVPIADLQEADYNPRFITEKKFEDIKKSLLEFGFRLPIIVNTNADRKNIIVGGHQRIKVAKALGIKEAPCTFVDLPLEKERELNIRLNKNTGEFDMDRLANLFEINDLIDWGFQPYEFSLDLNDTDSLEPLDLGASEEQAELYDPDVKLTDQFIIPPFTIFDTRQGYWRSRKRAWKALGLDSGLGREDNLLNYSDSIRNGGFKIVDVEIKNSGTSIFDPVLCEVIYKWFNVKGGSIFDPFAGGSVRGIVASKLGHEYTGIDLRPEQIEENVKQGSEILEKGDPKVEWILGNALDTDKHIGKRKYDLMFSCPPYFDLEQYSEDPEDLSNLKWEEFTDQYKEIISKGLKTLKNDRFACFIVGDIREPKSGYYRDLIRLTIEAFEKGGARLYNEMILLEPAGTAAMRASRIFKGGRKVCKTHQNILVFYKGDPGKIKEIYGEEVEVMEMNEDPEKPKVDATIYGEKIKLDKII
tara:strand:- start:1412 stop:2860 length:1449 start_codon:yes stop_codon:yes gene_type:complete